MDVLFKIVLFAGIWTLVTFETWAKNGHIINESSSSAHSSAFKPPMRGKLTLQHTAVYKATRTLRRQIEEEHDRVAFFVRLSSSVAELGLHQTIPFDEVILNEGHGFSNVIHVFTCPTKGVYLFQAALMSELNSYIEVDVVKNGLKVFGVYAGSATYNNGYDQGFNAGILQCDKGEMVWMRVLSESGTKVRHNQFTTFSGFLLWKTETKTTVQVGQRDANSTHVGFYAYLKMQAILASSQTTMPFDQVILNEGQAYNASTHVFTCPVSGLYMFQSALQVYIRGVTEIVKDGVSIVRVYAATTIPIYYLDQGFNAGITQCDRGQQIYVHIPQGYSGFFVLNQTTFSGYLIWERGQVSTATGQTGVGSNSVAFHAYLSNAVNGLGKLQTIPFDRVSVNEGHAFDTLFHAFTCPVNGVYMFRSALLSELNSHIETEIVKDGTPVFRMYASSSSASNSDQGFNTGIIQCDKGERVWVRVNDYEGTSIRHFNSTTFSGYLLWET